MGSYCDPLMLKGVFPWSELPLSPNLILPTPSAPKHMENEFEVSPPLANMLGTEMLCIPSPSRPFGAAPLRNEPV